MKKYQRLSSIVAFAVMLASCGGSSESALSEADLGSPEVREATEIATSTTTSTPTSMPTAALAPTSTPGNEAGTQVEAPDLREEQAELTEESVEELAKQADVFVAELEGLNIEAQIDLDYSSALHLSLKTCDFLGGEDGEAIDLSWLYGLQLTTLVTTVPDGAYSITMADYVQSFTALVASTLCNDVERQGYERSLPSLSDFSDGELRFLMMLHGSGDEALVRAIDRDLLQVGYEVCESYVGKTVEELTQQVVAAESATDSLSALLAGTEGSLCPEFAELTDAVLDTFATG